MQDAYIEEQLTRVPTITSSALGSPPNRSNDIGRLRSRSMGAQSTRSQLESSSGARYRPPTLAEIGEEEDDELPPAARRSTAPIIPPNASLQGPWASVRTGFTTHSEPFAQGGEEQGGRESEGMMGVSAPHVRNHIAPDLTVPDRTDSQLHRHFNKCPDVGNTQKHTHKKSIQNRKQIANQLAIDSFSYIKSADLSTKSHTNRTQNAHKTHINRTQIAHKSHTNRTQITHKL